MYHNETLGFESVKLRTIYRFRRKVLTEQYMKIHINHRHQDLLEADFLRSKLNIKTGKEATYIYKQ